MAIYGDNKHNYKTEAKQKRREKAEFYLKRAEVAKNNKNILITDVVNNLMENSFDYHDFIKDLMKEALSKRTQTELKAILYRE